MGDYMFLLETHLSVPQMRVIRALQDLSTEAQLNLFLSGGALRDLMGGFPTRDLDFTLEGDIAPIAKKLVLKQTASIVHHDTARKRMDLVSAEGTAFELRQAVEEKHAKPGGKPQVTVATIYEDLKSRDFSMNAMALSLSRASRGLLLDPLNGRSDLEAKQLRTASNTALYDDPARLLRAVRFKTRFGLTFEERTERQFENALEAGMADKITAAALTREFGAIAAEPLVVEILTALDEANLIHLLSPVLKGKLNAKAFEKLQKARAVMPFGTLNAIDPVPVVLSVLTGMLTPKEKGTLLKELPVDAEAIANFQKMPATISRLEKKLAAASTGRPTALYQALADVPGEQVVLMLMQSNQRIVQDRLKKFLQNHVPIIQTVSDDMVTAQGLDPTTPKGQKAKLAIIIERLNAKPKKVEVEEVEPEPPPAPMGRGRRN